MEWRQKFPQKCVRQGRRTLPELLKAEDIRVCRSHFADDVLREDRHKKFGVCPLNEEEEAARDAAKAQAETERLAGIAREQEAVRERAAKRDRRRTSLRRMQESASNNQPLTDTPVKAAHDTFADLEAQQLAFDQEMARWREDLERQKEEAAARQAMLEAQVELLHDQQDESPWRLDRVRVAPSTKDMCSGLTGFPSYEALDAFYNLLKIVHPPPVPMYHGDLDVHDKDTPEHAPGAKGAGTGHGTRRKRKQPVAAPAPATKRGGRRPRAGCPVGSGRALVEKDELFLYLFLLRTGTPNNLAAVLFGVDESTVSRIFIAWTRHLRAVLEHLLPLPSKEHTAQVLPLKWKRAYGSKAPRIIVAATELELERCVESQAQRTTCSNYKNRNTIKFLVGLSPAGAITYCSQGYPGRISDRDLLEVSGLLQLLEEGDAVCADKGFQVHDLLAHYAMRPLMPPTRYPGVSVFTPQEVAATYKVALRIQIERAIQRIKCWRFLGNAVRIVHKDLIADVFFVCAMLVNLTNPPL